MDIKNISKNPKKVLHDSMKRLHKASTDPYTDWAFLVFICLILIIAFFFVGYWIYDRTSKEINTASSIDTVKTEKIFDEKFLGEVLRELDIRTKERESQRVGGYTKTSDPSL